MSDLIVVKQSLLIEERLKKKSEEIKKKVDDAKALVCTEDTVKLVKKTRAELNKEFNEIEAIRKQVKTKALEPYEAFEKVYKEYVSDLFKSADSDLKSKVDEVEGTIRLEKQTEIKSYFEELKTSLNIDFVEFKQTNLKILLSNTLTSLKKEVYQILGKVKEDLDIIETQENKAEILVEYKKTLNVSQSIVVVSERIQRIAEEKKRQAERQKLREGQAEVVEKIEKVIELKAPTQAPTVEQPIEKLMTATFKVTATKEKLIELKRFLRDGGYIYE